MQQLIYRFALKVYKSGIDVAAIFNPKAKQFKAGRKNWREKIRLAIGDSKRKCIWMHCASLGEYEQGRTVLEAIQKKYPDYRTIVTFFSPSGYEVKKGKNIADHVLYLPIDSPANASDFLDIVNPSLCIFVKYEYWFYYLKELKERKINTLLISAIFRESQPFFKFYGSLHREMLKMFTHFFVQDEASVQLLNKIGIDNATVAGDTRFDRVLQIQEDENYKPFFEDFCNNRKVLVAGSTWPADEKILADVISKLGDEWNLLLFPHEVDKDHINEIMKVFGSSAVRLSEYVTDSTTKHTTVLVVDSIGLLGSSYRYGKVAYVGGGFNKSGIHNILEAAVYGLPVFYGPEYHKFREARELVKKGGAVPVRTAEEIIYQIRKWENDKLLYGQVADTALSYVKSNTGATDVIMNYISEKKLLTMS